MASYNIRKAVGLDWKRKPERILAVLDEIAPDVAVLQEADKRLGPRPAAIPLGLIATHGIFEHLDPGPGPSLGWHGNAVLLKKGLKGEVLDLIDLPGLEPRGAILARIHREDGKGTFALVAAHLGLNRGSRHRQIAAIIEATRNLGMPVVMAGDLNERAPDRLLAPFHRDMKLVTPGPSFHASHPFVALDHIILSGKVQVARAKVHATPLAHVASDHLPIWADMTVAP
ncbi:endonuclease/exonuclease/phosphatase family protein [Rubellimicrobium mesophilum DSM 19309]|uniref:Endonuclease/exonuclease/phosphatase family protein n=1 Tax=Rubellimicrobium mesophilum DSM 19309 TaxID=442562 RepID=A0A017HSH4_9RHOB|nr:endonuclease/exonuclease/phosphatase family protein [Rubellimicrobium mesophilum]EYD76704.1 endonuclease/exonuclease/phosphatase family protein [Rubellimicrobium mesophilum DSM 19309]